ncbi:IclR family transcriptional regulator domain-containing protein [Aureimonas populi]|uniref:IclR family transcriptional regulator C-terminal domain-containing protein n=1 Tax=Aureimonas populi TaxID=1701758 RepID=A0ABW5CQH0_9HYPH|nr:IclR family transcriptional regulator C-terminal domain-containing protein [Aureimonas populi]
MVQGTERPRGPGGPPLSAKDISLTFAKGMSVLKAFDATQTHLTLPQVARATGLDRATARRLVLTLVHLGYIKAQDRVFSLTPRILVLAGGFLQGRQFGKTIEPVMRSFSHRISSAISMAMIDGHEAVYVAHAAARESAVSIGFTVGSRVPLLSSAIGRALLSVCASADAEELIARAPLERHTAATILDRQSILEDVALTARRGYACVEGEFEPGICAIAVPLRANGGEASAIGVSGDAEHYADPAVRQRAVSILRECASVMAELVK